MTLTRVITVVTDSISWKGEDDGDVGGSEPAESRHGNTGRCATKASLHCQSGKSRVARRQFWLDCYTLLVSFSGVRKAMLVLASSVSVFNDC